MATSERLSQALENSPFSSINAFKEAINKDFAGVKGRSYSSIHSYFSQGIAPPLEFLEASAEVLGVDLNWLRTGEGSMEPQQHIGQTNAEWDGHGPLDVVQLFQDVTAIEGLQWIRQHAGDLMISSWWNATKNFLQSCPDAETASYEDLRVIGWWVLCTALRPFGRTHYAGRSEKPRLLTGTLNLLFQGIAQAAPDPKKGKSLADLVAGLLDDESGGPTTTEEE